MRRLPQKEHWRPARDVPFLLLFVAVAAGMWRTVDQPDATVDVAGTEISLVPGDLAIAALAAACALRLLGRAALPRPARAITATASLFFGWLLITSAAHGADAFVGAARLLEYGVLALGTVLFVRRRAQVWLLAGLLVAVTAVGIVDAAGDFVDNPGKRSGSFLGAHDFAALGTLCLTLGLAAVYAPGRARTRFSLVAGLAGGTAMIFAAAFASLLGFYLAVAAIVGLAFARRAVTRRALVVTAATVAAVTIGVFGLRTGDIGFIHELLGTSDDPGETASGWSQRLIYSYIGLRIFSENPILGTGWYGELPPGEYARFLPDARERFSEQPPHYFPTADGTFLPQQTYDQVLFELGLVGAVLFVLLGIATVRTVLRTGRTWPRLGAEEQLAYVPAAWVGCVGGALAGAALFGGIPLTTIFWLTLGIAAVMPTLVPPEPAPPRPVARREPAAVVG